MDRMEKDHLITLAEKNLLTEEVGVEVREDILGQKVNRDPLEITEVGAGVTTTEDLQETKNCLKGQFFGYPNSTKST